MVSPARDTAARSEACVQSSANFLRALGCHTTVNFMTVPRISKGQPGSCLPFLAALVAVLQPNRDTEIRPTGRSDGRTALRGGNDPVSCHLAPEGWWVP